MRILPVLCLALLVTTAARADEAQDEASIRQLYKQADAALAQRDVNGMLAMVAPDFVSVDEAGRTEDLATMRSNLVEILGELSGATARTDIVLLVVKGDRAWVTAKGVATLTYAALPGHPAMPAIGITQIDVDDWTRTAQGWQLTRDDVVMQRSQREAIGPAGPPKPEAAAAQ